MARVTFTLSEVCETLTGLNFENMSGLAFDIVDDIAIAAIPKLFSNRYTLLDDAGDREDLERMILERYWDYEIQAYTPAEFALKLNRRLNQIAPYYNALYESTKLQFPVFEDTDYTDVGEDGFNESVSGSNESSTKNSGTDENVKSHTGDLQVDDKEYGTTKVKTKDDNVKSHTGDVKVTDKENGNTKVTSDSTDTDMGHTNIDNKFNNYQTTKHHVENMKTDWDYNNDTPQGSISGVSDNDYLTGYSKHTSKYGDEKFGFSSTSTTTFFDGSTISFKQDDSSLKRDNMMDVDGGSNTEGLKHTTEGTSKASVEQDTTHGRGNDNTTQYGDIITDDLTGSQDTEHGRGNLQITEYGDSIVDTMEHGHNIDTKGSDSRKTDKDGHYSKAVQGKANSGKSYSQMLLEYRDTITNIYDAIINDLHQLFFKIA